MKEVTLTWKEHHNNLCGMFEKLLEESVLVDCTLAAEGKYVNVHKTILSAVSPYFELLFAQESENNPIVILTDIKFQDLKAMIDFIYRGKVTVSEEYLDDFVLAAESLQIKGLGKDCIKNQKRNGTAVTDAPELPNCISHNPLNQLHVNKVSDYENCGTATPSSLKEVDEHDFSELSAISSQMDSLNSCRINQCSTSVHVVDNSIPSRLAHRESELNTKSTSNSLCLETQIKCEPTSEEVVLKMEFVQCEEEWVEEDAPHCFSPSETTCKSTSSSGLAAARGLQTDPLSFCERHQSTFYSEIYTSETACAEERDVDVGEPKVELLSEVDVLAEGAPSPACMEGGKVFGDASQPGVHARTHTRERPFACEACGKAFKHLSFLRRHQRKHTGERPFVCHMCGKAFPHADTLTRHLRAHAGERPYECRTCGKAFTQSSSLNTHLRTHSGERPFTCDLCGKAFPFSGTLKRHLRTHTGERPYACRACGKTFTQCGSLKAHLRVHEGERPYACPTCGKAFAKGSTLKEHLRIHKGERPFVCEVCGKTFRQSSALAKHKRSHARRSPTTPPSSTNCPRQGTG